LSFFQKIAAFLVIALLCSIFLAYFGAVFNHIRYGIEEKNVSPLYFAVIIFAGIVIGIPFMQVIHNLGISVSRLSLSLNGVCAGGLTGLALFGWWMPLDMLMLYILMSSIAGGLSGLLWHVFVERHRG
jgi:hypothetical protein